MSRIVPRRTGYGIRGPIVAFRYSFGHIRGDFTFRQVLTTPYYAVRDTIPSEWENDDVRVLVVIHTHLRGSQFISIPAFIFSTENKFVEKIFNGISLIIQSDSQLEIQDVELDFILIRLPHNRGNFSPQSRRFLRGIFNDNLQRESCQERSIFRQRRARRESDLLVRARATIRRRQRQIAARRR